MASASYLSHLSSLEIEESEIESIISQAADLCALEQIAALNTSHLADAILPSDIEARFRKLNSIPRCLDPSRIADRSSHDSGPNHPATSPATLEAEISSPAKDSESPTLNPATHEAKIPSPDKVSESLKDSDLKLRSGLRSRGSPRESPSPPRQVCCFRCYSRRTERKKGNGVGDWGRDDESFSDLGSFSLRDERRRLKKVLKEQEKASREAEKLVELVKQASARLNVSAIDELLSDNEELK